MGDVQRGWPIRLPFDRRRDRREESQDRGDAEGRAPAGGTEREDGGGGLVRRAGGAGRRSIRRRTGDGRRQISLAGPLAGRVALHATNQKKAGERVRTDDLEFGKLLLYQLSYARTAH